MVQAAESPTAHPFVPFVSALQAAGVLSEFDQNALGEVLKTEAPNSTGRLNLLCHYYGVGAGWNSGLARRRLDRFFLYRDTSPVAASSVVSAIALLCPELENLELTKLGDGERLLRTSNQFAPIEVNAPDVALERIFSCVNSLLARNGVADRFVRLLSDEGREAYLATNVTAALNLCQADYLEHDKPEDVMSLGHW